MCGARKISAGECAGGRSSRDAGAGGSFGSTVISAPRSGVAGAPPSISVVKRCRTASGGSRRSARDGFTQMPEAFTLSETALDQVLRRRAAILERSAQLLCHRARSNAIHRACDFSGRFYRISRCSSSRNFSSNCASRSSALVASGPIASRVTFAPQSRFALSTSRMLAAEKCSSPLRIVISQRNVCTARTNSAAGRACSPNSFKISTSRRMKVGNIRCPQRLSSDDCATIS